MKWATDIVKMQCQSLCTGQEFTYLNNAYDLKCWTAFEVLLNCKVCFHSTLNSFIRKINEDLIPYDIDSNLIIKPLFPFCFFSFHSLFWEKPVLVTANKATKLFALVLLFNGWSSSKCCLPNRHNVLRWLAYCKPNKLNVSTLRRPEDCQKLKLWQVSW